MAYYYEIINYKSGLPIRVVIHSVDKYKLHWHKDIEILLVLGGKINLTIEGKNYKLEEVEFVIVNSNEIHSTSYDSECENVLVALQISSEYLTSVGIDIEKIKISCATCGLDKNSEEFSVIRSLIGEIVYELDKSSELYDLAIKGALNYLIIHLFRNFNIERQEKLDVDNDIGLARVQRIMNYVNLNYEKKISLSDIASMEYLNVYYLSHFFKDKVGKSFQDYLSTTRLKNAYNKIIETNKSIIDISMECGFPNVKSLNSLFRRTYNSTPTEFRKKKNYAYAKENNEQIDISYLEYNDVIAMKKILDYRDIKNKNFMKLEPEEICSNKEIKVDMQIESPKKLDHYWNYLLTFGRAYDCLRADSKEQISQIQKEIGFKYIRFHGIFSDEMRVVTRNSDGELVFCFKYIDEIFDFLLGINLKPFVEFTFIPSELKSKDITVFNYKGNISKPKDMDEWNLLITNFIKHCINRYGENEVEKWYFEVWNEPDMMWMNSQEEFLEFFKVTSNAVYGINHKLKIAGPSVMCFSINNICFFENFIEFIIKENISCPYITFHIYGEKSVKIDDMQDFKIVPLGGKKHYTDSIDKFRDMAKKYSGTREIHITEINVSARANNLILDTAFMATFIIDTALNNIGKVNSLDFGHAQIYLRKE